MTDQLDLFSKRLVSPLYQTTDTIQERFEKFDAANGWVFAALVRLAQQAKAQGRTRIGIGHLVEVVRWQYAGKTQGSEFKLDNSFRSRYVRRMAEQFPELSELFETRRLRAA